MKIGELKKNIQKITCKFFAGYFFLRTFAPLKLKCYSYIAITYLFTI